MELMTVYLGEILLILMAAIGLCFVLVDGKIAEPVRDWIDEKCNNLGDSPSFFGQVYGFLQNIIGCHQCCGWWCGLLISAFYLAPRQVVGIATSNTVGFITGTIYLAIVPLFALMFAFASSYLCMYLGLKLDALELQIMSMPIETSNAKETETDAS